MPDAETVFKAGDKVVRTAPTVDGVVQGSEYVVGEASLNLLWLVGVEGVWHANKFELAKWVPKVGDLVNASKWTKWPMPGGVAINKPIKEIEKYTNYILPDQPVVDLYMIENDSGAHQWWPIEALTRADGTQPSIPQRKKRIYNA